MAPGACTASRSRLLASVSYRYRPPPRVYRSTRIGSCPRSPPVRRLYRLARRVVGPRSDPSCSPTDAAIASTFDGVPCSDPSHRQRCKHATLPVLIRRDVTNDACAGGDASPPELATPLVDRREPRARLAPDRCHFLRHDSLMVSDARVLSRPTLRLPSAARMLAMSRRSPRSASARHSSVNHRPSSVTTLRKMWLPPGS